jgi:hypothetical protein
MKLKLLTHNCYAHGLDIAEALYFILNYVLQEEERAAAMVMQKWD